MKNCLDIRGHYNSLLDNYSKAMEAFRRILTPPGLENAKKNSRISWLQDFNQIRKKYSHPQRENVTEKEYSTLKTIYEWLPQKMVQ